ncbi:MAG: substrate-binding domain-containing protein [Christensenellales bacterium]|jgi:ABC-type sugar transport system substrate-binding protein
MKKSLLGFLIICLCLCIAFGVTGCGNNNGDKAGEKNGESETDIPTPEVTEKGEPGKVSIGVLLKPVTTNYWAVLRAGIEEDAGRLINVTIEIREMGREAEGEDQLKELEYMVESGKYSAIVVSPMTPVNCILGIVKANERSIPIVLIEDDVDTNMLEKEEGYIAGYAGSDYYKSGQMAGHYIVDTMGEEEGGVAIVGGPKGDEISQKRVDGCEETLNAQDNIELVAIRPGDWEKEAAFEAAEDLIKKYGSHLKAIYAVCDATALGVLEAIEQEGREDIILVAGETSEETRAAVEQGKMAAVMLRPDLVGQAGVELAVKSYREMREGLFKERPPKLYITTSIIKPDNPRFQKGDGDQHER